MARVTIAQIAKYAEVSVPTVSKVLNGRRGVADPTRDRVLALLEEHGYRRRGIDRRSRVGLVDFVISGLDSFWAHKLLLGAEAAAAWAGVGLVVTTTQGRRPGNDHWIQQLAARRTDGVVLVVSDLMPGAYEQLARLNTPLVLVDPAGSVSPSIPVVGATNWAGGLAATDHLIGLGHRRIGVITGPETQMCSRDRLDGYRAALHRAGLAPSDDLIRGGDFLVAGGRRGTESLLALEDPPTAIFAGSDAAAYGVYLAAREVGLTVPDDLSVVGFDDLDLCEWIAPTLTTVRQPLMEMAREAMRQVLDLETHERPPPRIELATSLIVRASTTAPCTTSARRRAGPQLVPQLG